MPRRQVPVQEFMESVHRSPIDVATLANHIHAAGMSALSLMLRYVESKDSIPPSIIRRMVKLFLDEVDAALKSSLAYAYGFGKGDEMFAALSVDGVPMRDYIQKSVEPVIARSVEVAETIIAGRKAATQYVRNRVQDPLRKHELPADVEKWLNLAPHLEAQLHAVVVAATKAALMRSRKAQNTWQVMLDDMMGQEAAVSTRNAIQRTLSEKLSYVVRRIVETETHRQQEAAIRQEFLENTAVQLVKWTLSPTHNIVDVCDLHATVDMFGVGPGVYLKGMAPVAPSHPHCRCQVRPIIDQHLIHSVEYDDTAVTRYLKSLTEQDAAKVAGSKARLERALNSTEPMKHVRTWAYDSR